MRDWAVNGSEVFPVDIVHDVVRAIVETAHAYGLKVAAHAHGARVDHPY